MRTQDGQAIEGSLLRKPALDRSVTVVNYSLKLRGCLLPWAQQSHMAARFTHRCSTCAMATIVKLWHGHHRATRLWCNRIICAWHCIFTTVATLCPQFNSFIIRLSSTQKSLYVASHDISIAQPSQRSIYQRSKRSSTWLQFTQLWERLVKWSHFLYLNASFCQYLLEICQTWRIDKNTAMTYFLHWRESASEHLEECVYESNWWKVGKHVLAEEGAECTNLKVTI